jgi:putative protein kinase ArgK-like GTPase of G3E family
VPVLTASAATGAGVEKLWETAEEFRAAMTGAPAAAPAAALAARGAHAALSSPPAPHDNLLLERRRAQASSWMWADFEADLLLAAHRNADVTALAAALSTPLARGHMTPRSAAHALLDAFLRTAPVQPLVAAPAMPARAAPRGA